MPPFSWRIKMFEQNITEIFTFDQRYRYKIVLLGGIIVEGRVIDARDDGIVLEGLEHIPTDKILYFVPIKFLEEYETPE